MFSGGILRRQLYLCYSIVYYYNGAHRYGQFLQVGRLYRALILLRLLALYHPGASVSAVGSSPSLEPALSCVHCRCAVLLKDEARWQNRSAILNKFRQQGFNKKFSIYLGRVWNETQSSLPTETDARRNHDMLGEHCSLSYQLTFRRKKLVMKTSNIR